MRSFLFLLITVIAMPLFAGGTKIYSSYESTRQALLKASVAEVQTSAKELAAVARAEKQEAIAAKAAALAQAKDIAAARGAFAALSEAMIQFRAGGSGARPVVVYCSMEKKSWLQPKGEIGNPYVAPSMRQCGEVRAN
jgi:hypothetical protein